MEAAGDGGIETEKETSPINEEVLRGEQGGVTELVAGMVGVVELVELVDFEETTQLG